jgi:uncharacterized protein (DUF1015 family)
VPEIHPLRGWRYDTAVAGPLDELICPPYDVIAPADAARLLERNPRNAIRLELGPGAADPLAPQNRYRQAAATLEQWLADGTLQQDACPALYVYEQVFTLDGAALRRRAFLASVRLTPWAAGEVLPHEVTLATPKADRLALLEATRANISPIYALCDGALPGVAALLDVVAARPPDAAASDESGERHHLWVVDDDAAIAQVRRDLADRPLYIADGHHRYETALAYAQAHPGDDGAASVLMAVTPVDDPGLAVLPTHRLLRDLDEERLDYALTRLHEHFELHIVEGVPPAAPLLAALASGAGEHAVGFYTAGLARVLYPRPASVGRLSGLAPALRALDVALVQALLFEDVLGLTPEDLRRQSHVDYTRDAEAALQSVDAGTHQAAVILNGTPPRAILDVARAGAQMPQKSTYFYPKLATGLVLRRLDEA